MKNPFDLEQISINKLITIEWAFEGIKPQIEKYNFGTYTTSFFFGPIELPSFVKIKQKIQYFDWIIFVFVVW